MVSAAPPKTCSPDRGGNLWIIEDCSPRIVSVGNSIQDDASEQTTGAPAYFRTTFTYCVCNAPENEDGRRDWADLEMSRDLAVEDQALAYETSSISSSFEKRST